MLGDEDARTAAEALEPGQLRRADRLREPVGGPFAAAVKRNGGEVVGYQRIPVDAVLEALERRDRSLRRRAPCQDFCGNGPHRRRRRDGHRRLEPRQPPPGTAVGGAGAAAAESPPPPQQSGTPPPPAPDPIEQLRQLGELKQQGVLTEDEFAQQKARILAG